MLLPSVDPVIVLFCRVVSHDERILGQFLEEALGRGAVDKEVERLRGRRGQRQERQGEPHDGLCQFESKSNGADVGKEEEGGRQLIDRRRVSVAFRRGKG